MTLPSMTLRFNTWLLAGLCALLPIQMAGATELLDEPTAAAIVAEELASEVEPEPEGLQILDAAEVDPDEFLWQWRILAVMADTPNDPAFVQQMRDIEARANDLFERDVVVVVDTSRASGSPLRQRLRPRGFMLAIIDKDGEVKQRRPAPRAVRELTAVIDRFPLRRQEILERLPGRH
jgi:hypothetical protein